MLDWAYAGVDYNIPGNGGHDCLRFLSVFQRVVESLIAMLISIKFISRGYKKIIIPNKIPDWIERTSITKRVLLVIHCLVFGTELGFKLASRQMIWVLNPCHIITMVQIYLLAAPPSMLSWAAFRLHMYMLSGAPLALLFPVINTRLLEFEKEVYYIQHSLMLVVPIYLLRLGGIYTCEEMNDLSWASVAIGILIIYHFIPLQIIASLSQVNLNNMLCPAVSDPFSGQLYRVFAIAHQVVCLPFIGKLLNWIGLQISLDRKKPSSQTGITAANCSNEQKKPQLLNHTSNLIDDEPNSTMLSCCMEGSANVFEKCCCETRLRHLKQPKKEAGNQNTTGILNPVFKQNRAQQGSVLAEETMADQISLSEHCKSQ